MYAARTGHDWYRLRPRVCDPRGPTAGAAPVERAVPVERAAEGVPAAVPEVPEAEAVPEVPEAEAVPEGNPLEGVIEVRKADAPHDTIKKL